MKKINKPLFMWAGGKTRMIKHYTERGLLPSSSVVEPKTRFKTIDNYVEPFFGGGAMFLHINKVLKPKTCVINDINSSIIGIYTTIKYDYISFIKEVDILEEKYIPMEKVDRKKYYYKLRDEHAFQEGWTKTKEAAYLFFLMKTGFNGLWQINKNTNDRFGTPSGLLNQKDKIYDKENVKFWHDILQNTTITSSDWREVLLEKEKIKNSFYFLDPPYRGSFTSYGQDFGDKDQTDLVSFAKSVSSDSTVLLCNDDVDDGFFQDIQDDLKIESYERVHTAGRRATNPDKTKSAKAVKEIVLYNKKWGG